jgi:hypothetical protein
MGTFTSCHSFILHHTQYSEGINKTKAQEVIEEECY